MPRMLQTGGRFRFAPEAFQVRLGRPMAEANDLQRDCAVQTFLPRAIDHALTAATDFLEQFVITKLSQHLGRARRFLSTPVRHRAS